MEVLKPGTIVDERYEILTHIGVGGMGTVFKARELGLERIVALKIVHPGLLADEESLKRFEREGQILSSLSHRNILMFYRFGVWANNPYIAMEFVEGTSLRQLIDDSKQVPPNRLLHIALQVCDALQAAHSRSIVHRDLTPGNIMLTSNPDQDTVKIIDFGLARLMPQSGEQNQQLTQTGLLIGSIFYMSPEQCLGKKSDSRADIYSFGCVLYEALTGQPPLAADNPIGLMHKHVSEYPPKLSQYLSKTAMTTALNAVLMKAMAKDSSERYQSMNDLRSDLELCREGNFAAISAGCVLPDSTKTVRNPVLYAAGALTVAAAVAAGIGIAKRPQRSLDEHRYELAKVDYSKSRAPLGTAGLVSRLIKLPPGPEKLALAFKVEQKVPVEGERLNNHELWCIYASLVTELENVGRTSDALSYCHKFIAAMEKRPNNERDVAAMMVMQGDLFLKVDNFSGAEKAFRRAETLCTKAPAEDETSERLYLGLSRSLSRQLRYDDAYKALKKAPTISSAFLLNNYLPEMSTILFALKRNAEEQKAYQQMQDIAGKLPPGGDLEGQTYRAYSSFILSASNVGEYDISLSRCRDAEKLFQKLNFNKEMFCRLYIDESGVLRLAKRSDECMAKINQALRFLPDTPVGRTLRTVLYRELALCYRKSPQEAKQTLLKGLSGADAGGEGETALLVELASLDIQLREPDLLKWIEKLDDNMRLRQNVTAAEVIACYERLARELAERHRFKESVALLDKCLKLLNGRPNVPKDSIERVRLQRCVLAVQDGTEKSRDFDEQVKAGLSSLSALKLERHISEHDLFRYYGIATRGTPMQPEAEKYIVSILERDRSSSSPKAQMQELFNTAGFFCGTRNDVQVEKYLRQAMELPVSEVGSSLHFGAVNALANFYIRTYQAEKVGRLVEECRKLPGLTHVEIFECEHLLGVAESQLKKQESALKHFQNAVEQARFDSNIPVVQSYAAMIDCYTSLGKFDDALACVELVQKNAPTGDSHWSQWCDLRRAIVLQRSGDLEHGDKIMERVLEFHRKTDYEDEESTLAFEVAADRYWQSPGKRELARECLRQAMKNAHQQWGISVGDDVRLRHAHIQL